MILVDKKFGADELIVDEAAGTLTIELKGTLLGTAEDVKIPLDVRTLLTALEAGMTNTWLKWAIGLVINLL